MMVGKTVVVVVVKKVIVELLLPLTVVVLLLIRPLSSALINNRCSFEAVAMPLRESTSERR